VYLRGRSPIAVNSNFYVLDSARSHPTTVPEARAAVLLYAMMRYRERLEAEAIPPVMAADGVVPLCSHQVGRRRFRGERRLRFGRDLTRGHPVKQSSP
jgi:hypothetical protein